MRNEVHGMLYREYPLRQCRIQMKNVGFYSEILERINDLLCCSREHYSKVFFVPFILKFPSNSSYSMRSDNEIITKFIEAIRSYFKDKYKTNEFHPDGSKKISLPLYLWAREMSCTRCPHYHVVIVVDGQHIQNASVVLTRARNRWASYFDIHPDSAPIDFCYSNYRDSVSGMESPFRYGGCRIDHYLDHETVVDKYDRLFEYLSYFAKIYSKVANDDPYRKVKSYSCSQMPRYDETVREVDWRVRMNKRDRR